MVALFIAFANAGFTQWRSSKQAGRDKAQDKRQDKAELREADRERRQMATQVMAWTGDRITTCDHAKQQGMTDRYHFHDVVVRNMSDYLIFSVWVTFAPWATTTEDLNVRGALAGVIPPGGEKVVHEGCVPNLDTARRAAVEIHFTDAEQRCWLRRDNGELVELGPASGCDHEVHYMEGLSGKTAQS